MSLVNFPIMYIPDPEKGRPIFKGGIYIGLPDLDPKIPTNQKLVSYILEDGSLVTAEQPIETSAGGVPVYNGMYVSLDVDGNYSLRIDNKLGAQVYYISNVPESGGGGGGGDVIVPVTVQLNAGQLIINTAVEASTGVFYVSDTSTNGLSRRLTPIADYAVTNSTTITLTSSYSQGAYFTQEGSPTAKSTPTQGVRQGPVELIAHRGFREVGFQNTLLSISKSKAMGATSIELDASISSDGVWYAFHDTTLDSLTDGTGNFIDTTSTVLDTLEYNKADNTVYNRLSISRLSDILNYIRESGMKAYIEMKNLRNDVSDVQSFLDLVDSYGLIDFVNVSSFINARVSNARSFYPQVETAFLVNSSDHAQNVIDAKTVSANGVINEYTTVTSKANVDLYFDAGLDLALYTVDFAFDIQPLIQFGVRKFISDKVTI